MTFSEFWSPQSIRSATGGIWVVRGADDRVLDGISIDTRTLQGGQAFLALRGDRFDGHSFLSAAVAAGAAMLIVDNETSLEDRILRERSIPILKVRDTLECLVRLASIYRQTLVNTRVIGITGSNGKTTTAALIHSILSTKLRGTTSKKSYNNIIGVPLTILAANSTDQYLICEVGMNSPGEIEALARIVQPDIGVVTSIGRAHIEQFKSIDEIAREKASLLAYLRAGGYAIATADAPSLRDLLRPIANTVLFGIANDADIRLTSFTHAEDGKGSRVQINGRTSYDIPLLGFHNAQNAMAAIAVARRMGLDDESIRLGMQSARSPEMRLQVIEHNEVCFLNDAYNASPESMHAALDVFRVVARNSTRRVLILGDMLELGDQSIVAHREIADSILQHEPPDLVISVGQHALHIASTINQRSSAIILAMFAQLDEDAVSSILRRLHPGDAVLLKGSRRIRLERILDAWVNRRASQTNANSTSTFQEA